MFCHIVFPDLDGFWDEVPIGADVVLPQRLLPSLTEVPEHHEYSSEPPWRNVEEVHGLVPCGELGRRHVTPLGPSVSFALHDHLSIVVAQVEEVGLPTVEANRQHDGAAQGETLRSEISLDVFLELASYMGVANGPSALEWSVLHILCRTSDYTDPNIISAGRMYKLERLYHPSEWLTIELLLKFLICPHIICPIRQK